MLSQSIQKADAARFATIRSQVEKSSLIAPYLLELQIFDPEAARDEMCEWVRSRFTRLIEFAYYDSESENGYSWPDVDINMELQEEFDQQFPSNLIEEVASYLECEGPWGEEDYGFEDA